MQVWLQITAKKLKTNSPMQVWLRISALRLTANLQIHLRPQIHKCKFGRKFTNTTLATNSHMQFWPQRASGSFWILR